MSRTLYLLRHGQTEYNVVRRLQGRCDSALTTLGQAQARAMGEALRRELGDAQGWQMRVSPLLRAQCSARLVAQALGLPETALQLDERLVEVGFGDWEAQLRADLIARHPHLDQAPDWHFHAPNGEALAAVLARIDDFLADPALPARLIVVSHGLFGRLLRHRYSGAEERLRFSGEMPQDAFFRLADGGVTRIDCQPLAATP
ncbi:histidine phosphatase family protein [Chitiniphilus purpureus]|uniref:Histidine phosphatase family protein n=1 Tax=Chitiniphilus purpureus TaxID=2981137 RepID=A0ABY6DIX4_9NEIS|nr:histidine phosphatase family protein [Chitiniphilus sp. CD1]UXY13643.1 histidine phosphatase family protein [Chitiniphilus sp. CD1]